MSLFERLNERMRARDSQDDPKTKDKNSDDSPNDGGLFGAVQLSPAQSQASVPPPRDSNAREDAVAKTVIAPGSSATDVSAKDVSATSSFATTSDAALDAAASRASDDVREITARAVPSLEEARAELDRARAQRATQNAAQAPSTSGLFRRDRNAEDPTDDTPRAQNALSAPDALSAPARQTVSFGEVSLPLRTPNDTPSDVRDGEPVVGASGVTSEEIFATPPPEDKPFRVPSLSQFGSRETARETVTAPAVSEAETAPPNGAMTSESGAATVYAPTLPDANSSVTRAKSAPDASHEVEARHARAQNVEETVYAPAKADEREVVARTPAQTVPASELVETIDAMRNAEVPPDAPRDAPRDTTSALTTEAPNESAPAAPQSESAAIPPRASDPIAAPDAAPPLIPRSARDANLTPFQRLMAARAAQSGPPISRPRAERPTPPVTPSAETPAAESPEVETPMVEVPALEVPAESSSVSSESGAEISAEITGLEAPVVVTPDDASAPLMEVPRVQAPVAAVALTAPTSAEAAIEVPDVGATNAPESATEPKVEAPALQTPPPSETPVSEADAAQLEQPETLATQVAAFETVAQNAALESETAPEAIAAALDDEETATDKANLGIEAPDVTLETAEAETVPEETQETEETSTSSEAPRTDDSADSAMIAHPPAQNDNDNGEARPALSLAERLARAPRAELDAAHAEAQALTPEVLDEAPSARENAPGQSAASELRRTTAMSFAERLAARSRANSAPPIQTAPPTELQAEAPREPQDDPTPAPTPESAPENATPQSFAPRVSVLDSPADEADEPRRSGPRSFTERLAARTGLDSHLQVPAEPAAPSSQELANANTELARIDEGAQLSEREMKNRVLFRQKHLMFDSVMGALDPRVTQNPTRQGVKAPIERAVDAASSEFNLDLEGFERNWMVDEFVREITDLGALVPLLEDPSVSKIVVTGSRDVSVERLGRIERTGLSFRDDDHLLNLVRRIAEMSGGRVDAKVPLLDRPLPDGGRIRAKVPPLAPQPTLTIEKSTGNPFVVLKRQMDEKSRGDSLPYAQLRERIQQKLLREFEGDAASLQGDQDKLRQQVEEMIGGVIAEEQVVVTRAERASLVMDLLNEIVGLGPIEPLLNDPDVDEVMVNGPYQIYVERKGKLELTSQRFRDNGHVMQVIDRIVAPLGRRVDEKSPMVDGRLRDGSRFNAIIPPLALSGPTMTIRKFARDPFTMSDLINFGSMTREAAQFLQAAVEGRLNIVVSGGTGSGKTTTLNVLSSFIPSTERIVTIEDAAELQMRQEHVIRMETRPPNIEGVGEIGIRDLVRNSLRMRPDRIVVGECRGGEALDMLQAMNTGHDGSLTTAHSNGPRDTCKRLETMVMMAGFDLPVRAIREQISMAVQLVVHQERMRDGKRRVTAITEIVGMEGDVLTLQDIFRFEQEGMDDDGRIIGQLQATGMRPKYYETIIDNGVALSMDIFQPKPQQDAPRGRMQERGGR